MPTLTDEIKEFIVKGLATFGTPSEVADSVKETFDVEVTRQHVYSYDPNCTQPPALRWCEIYAATRAAYLEQVSAIGITHKTYRLQMLDRMVHHAMKHHYPGRAQALLEQAAKECGGHFDRALRERASSKKQVPNRNRKPRKAPRRQARKTLPTRMFPEAS